MRVPGGNESGVVVRYVIIQLVLLAGFAMAIAVPAEPVISRGVPSIAAVARLVGALLCLASLVLAFAAFRALSSAFRVAPDPKESELLRTQGVYRLFRHPMYTAVVFGVTGLTCLRPTFWVFLCAVALCVFYLVKARHEEALLRETYPEYENYQASTWGLFPGIRR